MSDADVIVVPYQPHGAARPSWVIYGRRLAALAEGDRWRQLAVCIDEDIAGALAAGLARMSPTYLASLTPQEPF